MTRIYRRLLGFRKTSATSIPVLGRRGIDPAFRRFEKENGPLVGDTSGAIPVSALALVAMVLDDHRPVVMVPVMMPIMMTVAFDHNGLGAGDGRRRDSDRTDCGDNVSKFLHVILLHVSEG